MRLLREHGRGLGRCAAAAAFLTVALLAAPQPTLSAPIAGFEPAPPPPPPPPPRNADPVDLDFDDDRPPRDYGPTPLGAHALKPYQVGFVLELGYPFVTFRAALGLPGGVELEAGYRGFYGFSNAAFGGLKWTVWENAVRRTAVALRLIGGYGEPLRDPENFEVNAGLVGGAGGFGELSLRASSRAEGRRVGFLFGTGLRLSDYFPPPCTNEGCDRDVRVGGEERGVIATFFFEAGFEVRIGLRTSYFLAVGVDIFARLQGTFPAMLRFRQGFGFDF